MTLTDAKTKFGLDEIAMRVLINSNLKREEDYYMDTVRHKWVLNFTERGEMRLSHLIERQKKEHVC